MSLRLGETGTLHRNFHFGASETIWRSKFGLWRGPPGPRFRAVRPGLITSSIAIPEKDRPTTTTSACSVAQRRPLEGAFVF